MAHYAFPSILIQQFYNARTFLIVLCFLSYTASAAQEFRYITVHFLYGSKPAAGYHDVERKWFGGLHGGHVSIQFEDEVIGFEPRGRCHIFAHRKRKHCAYLREDAGEWVKDTSGLKYLSIRIPLRAGQYDSLKNLQEEFFKSPPFDYAFFGMRCASSTYCLLSRAGIIPQQSRFLNIVSNFYPKPFRKKMMKLASRRAYEMSFHEGRKSRRWEKDHFFAR